MIEAHPLKVPSIRSRSVTKTLERSLGDPGKSGKMSVNEYLTVMRMSAADRLSRELTASKREMLRFGKLGEVGDAVGPPAEASYSAWFHCWAL